MSIAVPPSQQRLALDQNQRQIARTLLTALQNLPAFNDYITTISAGPPDALEAEPYLYTAEEAYAIRLWAQHAALYAALFDQGGTLSAGDATALSDLTRKSAGPPVYVNQGA
jgi:inactivated superfamily I helicase